MFIARELTKKFETQFLGSISECVDWLEADENQQKGEFVVIVAGCPESEIEVVNQQRALDIVQLLGDEVSTKQAISVASQVTGARKNQLYDLALKNKKNNKKQ